ncbi:CLUMA_CG006998, isoform A [Clunio marinus]|uniref:CLUMA_CG006998, isoform A n=1 Tax=Clunio marinus TaxID=568069 RepID=A0A1J1I3M0_9DIPT|nr:CLUMA_CG006998, isoform A [Clunio marinus]
MWLVYIALVILFIYILDQILIDKRLLELSEKFNGPKRLPIVGNALEFLGIGPKEYYDFVKKNQLTFGRTKTRISRFWIGNQIEINVDDPKHLEIILTNNKFLSKSSQYSFLNASLGDGLLFSTNQKWFTRRRIITPTFHFKILEQFFEVFIKHNQKLMSQIEEKADGKMFDIFPFVTASVMNAICETAMGCEMKAEDFEYLEAVKDLGYHVSTRFLTPWQRIDFLFNLSSTKREQDKCARIMHKFTTKIIEERRQKLMEEKAESLGNLDDDDVGLKKKMCLLDVLLLSKVDGESLTNADIQEEVDTFTFAGHDTTTNAICFTLYTIAKYPGVQEKLNEEIQRVFGDRDVTFKGINEMKYLDLVIKETMRLYPPVPIISRRLHEEVDFGDFIAPANANYNLILYTLFKNPEVFEKPEEFIPERFLSTEKSPYAFIPFSAGQRNCIGQKFALLNVKNNLINIMRKFDIIWSGKEPSVQINLTLKCDGIFIGFKPKK